MARSDRWNTRVVDFVRRIRLTALVALLTCGVAGAVSYTRSPVIIRHEVDMGRTGVNNGVWTKATYEAYRNAANGTSSSFYASRSLFTSSDTIGKLGSAAAKGGRFLGRNIAAALIWEAVMRGAGWAINELTHEVQVPGTPGTTVPPGTQYWTDGTSTQHTGGPQFYATYAEGCSGYIKRMQAEDEGFVFRRLYNVNADLWICEGSGRTGITPGGISGITSDHEVTFGGTDPQPVPQGEVGQKIVDNFNTTRDPTLINEVLKDPNGNPIRTPEVVDGGNELQHSIEDQEGQPRSPDQLPDPDYDTKPTPQEQTDTDRPAFCEWAKYVCDWIDWTKKDPETDEKQVVPQEEADIQRHEWNSGLPSDAGCPDFGSINATIMGHAVSLPTDSISNLLCQGAEMLRGVIIAVSLLISAYIIGGRKSV